MSALRIQTSLLSITLGACMAYAFSGEPVRGMHELPPFPDPALHALVQRAIVQMDGFHGDSAMATIHAAMELIDTDRQIEEYHYLLCYRAEVLYYEGLFNEAMQDLNEAERLAQVLQDSTLLANAYNLKGILHENIQDSREALPYLKKALHWFPKAPAARYPVSELYHIHGNLGSHLTALGQLDSARHHLTISLHLATATDAQRAMAVAWWGLGNIEMRQDDPLRALGHYDRSWAIADSAQDHDIAVDALIGRGLALAQAGQVANARSATRRAQDYLHRHQAQVGLVTQRNFAKQAAKVHQRIGDLGASITALAEWHRIDSTITANNIRSALRTQALLLKSDGELNLERLARERVAEQLSYAERTRLWVVIGSILALAAVSSIYLVNSSRQRHKRRLAEVEAEHAIQERTIAELRIREEVSRDLHDDLGVGLSALKLRNEMNVRQDPNGPAAAFLREQAGAAEGLISSMRDIIWAMQDDQGNLDDLVAYISSHARNYLDGHGIGLISIVDERWPTIQLTTRQRRNIFLVLKEALHNVVKHAHAQQVSLTLKWDRGLHAAVADDGCGMPETLARKGHGSVNMGKRAQQVGALFHIGSGSNGIGTVVSLHVPFVLNES